MDDEIRNQATDLLLERGVQFALPLPHYLAWAIPKRWRQLTIRHLKAGTILEIERLVLLHKLSDNPLTPEVAVLAEIIALAVLNRRMRIKLFRRPLTQWLLWGISSESLLELFGIVRTLNRLEDFTTITIWTLLTARMTQARMGQ